LALVTSELVTNAVVHAGTDLEVRVSCEGRATCIEVLDGSRAYPEKSRPRPCDTGGRGLVLVDALVDEWGVVELDGQDDGAKVKKVWIRVAG